MAEKEEKKSVTKLDPNRHRGKTFAQIEKETIEDASKIIDQNQNLQDNNVEFKIETNKAGDVEYHRYEDANPNDTDPARLTGIFTQDQMDKAIQARKDDGFYDFDEQKIDTPKNTNDVNDTDITPFSGQSLAGAQKGSVELLVVINGIPQTVTF